MSKGLYPIRTISAMTGVNPVTLRAWERRYGLIRPQRTPKGHRLYTERDIDRIQQILVLLERGIPISQAQQVLDDDDVVLEEPQAGSESEDTLSTWDEQRHRWRGALANLDEHALDSAYSETLALFPADLVHGRLLRPLLADLAAEIGDDSTARARHRFLTAFLKNKLSARFHHQAGRATGPKLIAATAPGECDDLALMLAACGAQSGGYRVVLLGASVDAETLAAAGGLSRSAAVLLSAHAPSAPPGLLDALRGLEYPVFMLDGAAHWVTNEGDGGNLIPARDATRLLQLVGRHVPPATVGRQRSVG